MEAYPLALVPAEFLTVQVRLIGPELIIGALNVTKDVVPPEVIVPPWIDHE